MLKKMLWVLVVSFISLTVNAENIEKLSKGKWLQLTTKNFKMITDLNEKKARILMKELEDYNYFQREMMGVQLRPDLQPLPILAISSRKSIKYAGLPSFAAGVFKFEGDYFSAIANVNGYTGDPAKQSMGRHFFMHEYNHFLSKYAIDHKTLPLWYEEGKAEYLATFKFDGEKIYLGNSVAIEKRSGGLYSKAGGIEIGSAKVLTAKALPKDGEKIAALYARAFFIVHYINASIERRKSLVTYLNEVNAGVSEEGALQKAFGQTFDQFDKSVEAYVVNSMMMRVISVKEGEIEFPEPEITVEKMTPETFRVEAGYFYPKW